MNLRDDMSQDPQRPRSEGSLRPVRRGEFEEARAKADEEDEVVSATHPVGTGIGAVGGAAAGAAIGAVGGPVGMAVGGIIGAIAGGAAGHGIAESINPSEEDAYWRQQYRREAFHSEDYDYADYEPAFRLGYLNYPIHQGSGIDEAEEELGREWEEKHRGESRLTWDQAKPAARAAWHRIAARHFGSRLTGQHNDMLERVDEDVRPLNDDEKDDVSIVDGERGRIH